VFKKAPLPDIVQLYDLACQEEDGIRCGLGDYLRGTLFLHQFCRLKGLSLGVCFSGHPLAKCMLSPLVLESDLIAQRRSCVIEDDDSLLDCGGVFFSNKFPLSPLSFEDKLFVRLNCLTPLVAHERRVSDAMCRMGLQGNDYYVLHVRLGDRVGDVLTSYKHAQLMQALDQLKLPKQYWTKTVLVTDSPGLRGIAPFERFLHSSLEVGHTGMSSASEDAILDSMAEFSLIARSSGVFQFSSYSWGSGFSGMACSVFDVPMYQFVKINGLVGT